MRGRHPRTSAHRLDLSLEANSPPLAAEEGRQGGTGRRSSVSSGLVQGETLMEGDPSRSLPPERAKRILVREVGPE